MRSDGARHVDMSGAGGAGSCLPTDVLETIPGWSAAKSSVRRVPIACSYQKSSTLFWSLVATVLSRSWASRAAICAVSDANASAMKA